MELLGSFIYREKVNFFARKNQPQITLRGDVRLKILFPYFQEVINSQVELDPKKDHVVEVERGEGNKFTFTIDHKKIFVANIPMAG